MKSNELDLLACPFCGGMPEITKHFREESYSFMHRCAVLGPISRDFRSDAQGHVDMWNSRVPVPTIVDLANADADGYRNGRASVVVVLPELCGDSNADDIAGVGLVIPMFDRGYDEAIDACKAAIIAAGGTVRE